MKYSSILLNRYQLLTNIEKTMWFFSLYLKQSKPKSIQKQNSSFLTFHYFSVANRHTCTLNDSLTFMRGARTQTCKWLRSSWSYIIIWCTFLHPPFSHFHQNSGAVLIIRVTSGEHSVETTVAAAISMLLRCAPEQ